MVAGTEAVRRPSNVGSEGRTDHSGDSEDRCCVPSGLLSGWARNLGQKGRLAGQLWRRGSPEQAAPRCTSVA